MSKFKIGDIVNHPKDKEVIKVLRYDSDGSNFFFGELLYDPNKVHALNDKDETYDWDTDYTLCNGYNTPLWKLLNE